MPDRPSRLSWRAAPPATAAFLAALAVLELWAQHAADPDFFLPDPFHPLAVGVTALFVLGAVVPSRSARAALHTAAIALPLTVVALERWYSGRDLAQSGHRIAASPDRLLRYTYRPGAEIRDGMGDEGPLTITPDGLFDVPHAVPKPAGVDRVVILGDSVPNDAAVPFRQRFPKRLEALLAARAPAGRRVEVVNVSCEGWSTLQEVRAFERVGARYEPDLVVVAYVLNDPFLQNGGYRRLGNSFFAFRLLGLWSAAPGRTACSPFTALHQGYEFDLVVRASFERLRLLTERTRTPVLVATLPLVAPFADAECRASYDVALGAAADQGFSTVRVADAFAGEDHRRYLKLDDPGDVTHPNASGHAKIAERLAAEVAPRLWGPR